MSSIRRRILNKKDTNIEYVVFDDDIVNKRCSYLWGDTVIGACDIDEGDIIGDGDNVVSSHYVFFSTYGFSAHKNSIAAEKGLSRNNISAKSEFAENFIVEIYATPIDGYPWDLTGIDDSSTILNIYRQPRGNVNVSIANFTKSDWSEQTSFTYSNGKWIGTFTAKSGATEAILIEFKASEGISLHWKIIAENQNHRTPVGITAKQMSYITNISNMGIDFTPALHINELRFCGVLDASNNKKILSANITAFYGGKFKTLAGDYCFSGNYQYVFIPRFTTSFNWPLRGSRNVKIVDLGWYSGDNIGRLFAYKEFINNNGWVLILRANSVLSYNGTFNNKGTIYVPSDLVTLYRQKSWINGAAVAAIGGVEWQAEFYAAIHPASEYANVEVYALEFYDFYYADYEAAKAIANSNT